MKHIWLWSKCMLNPLIILGLFSCTTLTFQCTNKPRKWEKVVLLVNGTHGNGTQELTRHAMYWLTFQWRDRTERTIGPRRLQKSRLFATQPHGKRHRVMKSRTNSLKKQHLPSRCQIPHTFNLSFIRLLSNNPHTYSLVQSACTLETNLHYC